MKEEEILQAAIYAHVNKNYPQLRGLFFMVHNNPKNKIDGARLVSMGLVSGVPDMLLLAGGTVVGVEIKTPSGVLSGPQRLIHKIWRNAGYRVEVVRSIEEVDNLLKKLF